MTATTLVDTDSLPVAVGDGADDSPFTPAELRDLQQRSDRLGALRLTGHLACLAGAGWLALANLHRPWLAAPALLIYGLGLVAMFACMHETVHRTAFRSKRANDTVAWFAGLLSFYNSTFYRHYHGWHHRFTQIPGRDPELDDPKPRSLPGYAWEISAVPWWIGKLRTHTRLAFGRADVYPFIPAAARAAVIRSVRLQLAVYLAAILASLWFAAPWFLWGWLVPVALAQPFLRAYLLAEHGGCSNDADPDRNTRTTDTLPWIRYLMWDMPYHAEHHRYPAIPFHALARAHARLRPRLAHVGRNGYAGFHRDLVRRLVARP